MDYIFLSSSMGMALNQITLSYDIACQWSVHFWKRMALAPLALRLRILPAGLRFMVPKFHLAAHFAACQSKFSFNFEKYACRADGEGVERIWAWLNGIASTTKELGPGGQSDMLDDFLGHHNWMKTLGLGIFFQHCLW
jgi:hypothetical protein